VRSARPWPLSALPTLEPSTPGAATLVSPRRFSARLPGQSAGLPPRPGRHHLSAIGERAQLTSRGEAPGGEAGSAPCSCCRSWRSSWRWSQRARAPTKPSRPRSWRRVQAVLVQKSTLAPEPAPSEPAPPAAENTGLSEAGGVGQLAAIHAPPPASPRSPSAPPRTAQESPDAKSGAPASSASQGAPPQVSSAAPSASPPRNGREPFRFAVSEGPFSSCASRSLRRRLYAISASSAGPGARSCHGGGPLPDGPGGRRSRRLRDGVPQIRGEQPPRPGGRHEFNLADCDEHIGRSCPLGCSSRQSPNGSPGGTNASPWHVERAAALEPSFRAWSFSGHSHAERFGDSS